MKKITIPIMLVFIASGLLIHSSAQSGGDEEGKFRVKSANCWKIKGGLIGPIPTIEVEVIANARVKCRRGSSSCTETLCK
ncbi:MAG: hypothetical protein AAF519_07855 [Bacteroidota bacterium]